MMNYEKSNRYAEKFHNLVPGGSHTYSKGDDQFPSQSPRMLARAKGAYTWDLDGNRFIDWAMGNRVMILGHADPVVNDYVYNAINNGVNFTRPGVLEYELAEFLIDLWPAAEMVKFGKNGSDVTTAAVKISRAYTGRDYVAVCADHPFFSIHDWFIGSTVLDRGIPEENKRHTVKFKYNDIQSVEKLVAEYKGKIACLLLEPVKNDEPKDGFLKKLRDVCSREGIVLIFDECISGMRFGERGAHVLYDVYPDLVCFGKAISNGFSCSVLAGKKDLLNLGGIRHDGERVFLLSQTHGSETTGLAATMITIKEYQRRNTKEKILKVGGQLISGFKEIVSAKGLEGNLRIIGLTQNPQIICTKSDGTYWPELTTLFHQYVISKGVFIPWISITDSHNAEHLEETFKAFEFAVAQISKFSSLEEAIKTGLVGPAVKPVFRKFN